MSSSVAFTDLWATCVVVSKNSFDRLLKCPVIVRVNSLNIYLTFLLKSTCCFCSVKRLCAIRRAYHAFGKNHSRFKR